MYQEEETRFRTIYEYAGSGIAITDLSGTVEQCNPAFCALLGYSETELQGINFATLIHPQDRGPYLVEARRLQQGELPGLTIDSRMLRKDGREIEVLQIISAMPDRQGRPVHLVALVTELSHGQSDRVLGDNGEPPRLSVDSANLKAAEDAFRSERDKLLAVVNTAVDSIVVINDSGIVQSANPATQTIFGYSAEELIGQNIKMLMPEEQAHAHDSYLSAYKHTGIRKIVGIGREVEARRKDGSTFPVDLAVAEWHDADGRRFYTGIMRDISERKKIEEALAHTQRLHAIGRLAGGVAHDINNLLAVIAGNLEVAEQRIQDQETQRLIQRALEAVEAGTSFNRRLLSLAQKRQLDRHRLVLNTRIGYMIKLLERTLGEDVEVSAKLAWDLWEVHCDAGEFDSALVNLAINARDAMPDGGRLEIATRNVALDPRASKLHSDARQGDYVCVSVTDTGIGMTPEVQRRAMDPFFTTKESGKGAGLGLSGACSFVHQSGGFVTLASEQGKGTTVSLYLPRALSDSTATFAAGAKEPPQGDGELILVVEDDDRVREITLKRLESLGYAVAEARSGPEAIKLLKSGEPIDLVFSDVVMPGKMTGYDVAQWVATMKPNIKVVLTTGYNDAKNDASSAGVNIPVLDKPYTRERLALTMRRALLDQSA